MSEAAWERLFGWRHAFDERLVVIIVATLVLVLLIAPLMITLLDRSGRLSSSLRADLWSRYFSWLIMVPIIVGPVLLGAAPTILAVGLLSLLCYREFARATGLFREKAMSATVVVGILAITLAVVDHWYAFFTALTPLMLALLTAVGISLDRPSGYIQRVGLAVFGFLLFGSCLGHLGFLANDAKFRSIILLLLFGVQFNDIFAYMVGKSLGGPKLIPNTSPNKTISGSLGAVILTSILVYFLSGFIFTTGPMSGSVQRLVLGILISIAGQFGDLSVSSIKRDVGVKDTGSLIPGHGGILDRANSLLIAAPTVFHYLHYLEGVGVGQTIRILSGGSGS